MSNKRKIAAIALVICLAAAGWAGYMGVSELLERKSGVDYYAELAAEVRAAAVSAAVTPEPTAAPLDAVQDELLPLDFDALRVSFPDIVGWISIEGTAIDYPVVQGVDNDFYLTHLPDKNKNSAGSIMMDVACDPAFGCAVTILHGHHMRSGAMFGDLDLYLEDGYYEEHPTMLLKTPDGNFNVEIFAATIVNGREYGYLTSFRSEEEFDDFMTELREGSAFESDVEVSFGDRMLMLSTCEYTYDDARLLVVGKIVE